MFLCGALHTIRTEATENMWESISTITTALWDGIGSFTGEIGSMAVMVIGMALIIFGTASVLFGRRLHGIFGAMFGLMTGIAIALSPVLNVANIQPLGVQASVLIVVGIVSTIVGMLIWKMMPVVVCAGAFAMLGMLVAQNAGLADEALLIVIAVSAFVGTIVAVAMFDWGVILGTSLTGAVIVCACAAVALRMSNPVGWLVFALYASAGIWQQSRDLQRQRVAREDMQLVYIEADDARGPATQGK